jgi:hypothetical protein
MLHPNSHRTDFYTAPHKGQRRRLFDFADRVGTADFADPDTVDALGAELEDLTSALRAHADLETRFIHPLLQTHVPARAAFLEEEHADLELNVAELIAHFQDITANPCSSEQCRAFGLEFYRALQRFIARYLDHIDEEERTMFELWNHCGDEELETVIGAMRAAVPPEREWAELAHVLPALNPWERVNVLRSLQRFDVFRFDGACRVAREVLATEDWRVLRAAPELGGTNSLDR